MSWTLRVAPSANREFKSLPDPIRDEAANLLVDLAEDPFPPDAMELRGHAGYHRVRFGDNRYRLIYRVSRTKEEVLIVRFRLRREAYRGLE